MEFNTKLSSTGRLIEEAAQIAPLYVCPLSAEAVTLGKISGKAKQNPQGIDELSLREENEIKAVFESLNTHSDKKIRLSELSDVLRRAFDNGTVTFSRHEVTTAEITAEGIQSELKKLVVDFDENGDGCLDWESFSRLAKMKILRLGREDELELGFRLLDDSNTGYITTLHLKELLTTRGLCPLTSEEADELLYLADTDNDGLISYTEILRYLDSNRNKMIN